MARMAMAQALTGAGRSRDSGQDARATSVGSKELFMKRARNSKNGRQMPHILREGRSMSKALQTQIDKAVSLADTEIGLHPSSFTLQTSPVPRPQPLIPSGARSPLTTPGGLPVAPTHAVPPTPPPEPISVAAYTERIRAGWVPVMGLPGTPITSALCATWANTTPSLKA